MLEASVTYDLSDEATFSTLYAQSFSLLTRRAMARYCLEYTVAQDITQIALCDLWALRARYPASPNPQTLMWVFVVWRVHRYFRDLQLERRHIQLCPEVELVAELDGCLPSLTTPSAEQVALAREALQEVMHQLDGLPPHWKAAFASRSSGFSLEDIMAQWQLLGQRATKPMVKWALKRARGLVHGKVVQSKCKVPEGWRCEGCGRADRYKARCLCESCHRRYLKDQGKTYVKTVPPGWQCAECGRSDAAYGTKQYCRSCVRRHRREQGNGGFMCRGCGSSQRVHEAQGLCGTCYVAMRRREGANKAA